MILVAGLTPACQRIMTFDSFTQGEVNRAASVTKFASGKPINVAIGLRRLSEARDAVTLLSAYGGHTGSQLVEDCHRHDIQAEWIETDSETRICTTLLSPSNLTTELVENAGPISNDELAEFRERFDQLRPSASMVVLTGSLPANAPAELYSDLIASCDVPVIVDAQGKPLAAAIHAQPWLVKPNDAELSATLGRTITSSDDRVVAMRAIHQSGAQNVLVTCGGDSAWLLSEEGLFRFEPPAVQVVNPIGCGDSLTAGLAWGVSRGLDLHEAVRVGIAAASENIEQLLAARLSRTEVNRLMPLVQWSRVSGL